MAMNPTRHVVRRAHLLGSCSLVLGRLGDILRTAVAVAPALRAGAYHFPARTRNIFPVPSSLEKPNPSTQFLTATAHGHRPLSTQVCILPPRVAGLLCSSPWKENWRAGELISLPVGGPKPPRPGSESRLWTYGLVWFGFSTTSFFPGLESQRPSPGAWHGCRRWNSGLKKSLF